MRNWERKLRQAITKHLSFPADLMLDLPKLTTVGNLHIYIENHDGLLVYKQDELVIKSHIGNIKITGSSLVIKEMLPRELLLEGKISQIMYDS